MTSEGISSQCDCEDANSVNGAWNCLLLLAWHSISSSWVYVLGFAVGATHHRCSLHLTTQSHFIPPLTSLPAWIQSALSRKAQPLAFWSYCFWLIMQSIPLSLPTPLQSDGVGLMPGDPPPSFSIPPSDLTHLCLTLSTRWRKEIIIWHSQTYNKGEIAKEEYKVAMWAHISCFINEK